MNSDELNKIKIVGKLVIINRCLRFQIVDKVKIDGVF